MARIAALTGLTGFLGRHTARALADEGWQIRALTRRAPDLPELADLEIALVPGSLAEPETLHRLCEGADAIIHIAGVVKARNTEGFFRANRDGALGMAAAWREAAPEACFTLVSSMAARMPHLSPYAASKRAGEEAVRRMAAGGAGGAAPAGDFRVLRPGAIYGAHDLESLKVLKLAAAPVQLMLNAGDARVSMIDARDAARAIARLAAHPGGGSVHELMDARRDGYSWQELTEIAARALGRTPRPLRLPGGFLRGLGAVGGALCAISGADGMLTPGKVREILHPDWSADPACAPVPADIWSPEITLADGLAHMAAAAGLAPRS